MKQTLDNLVKSFPTTPFLFVCSGLTRRYLNLPNWEELLQHFATRLSADSFKFKGLMNEANGNKAKVGSLIAEEFSKRWFNDPTFRSGSAEVEKLVENDVSPFKAELAEYIKARSMAVPEYHNEIELLKQLTVRNISGFITTNYDTFLEDIASGYKVYSSQEELLFSSIQGVGEIFKIHGSINNPSSLIITAEDYAAFDAKSSYLAAKLTTIFIEYPMIFIGYSLSDPNIRKILSSIARGLSDKHLDKLSDRLIFVKRNKLLDSSVEVSSHSIDIDGRYIPATKIETNNFGLIYEALSHKKSGYPVRLLRLFQEELYRYSLTENCSKHCVVSPYNPLIADDAIVFSVGVDDSHLVQGLIGVTSEQWYKSIIFDDELNYTADELLTHAYPTLISRNNKLPIYKYLGKAEKNHPSIKTISHLDELINNTTKRNRETFVLANRSVSGVIHQFSDDFVNTLKYLSYLKEDEIDIDELEKFIRESFEKHPKCLQTGENSASNMKRIIRMFDWLKYGKKGDLPQ